MSKYSVAKQAISDAVTAGQSENLDAADVLEALIVSAVQSLKEERDAAYVKGVLQYEVDSLGSGGTYEIQRR